MLDISSFARTRRPSTPPWRRARPRGTASCSSRSTTSAAPSITEVEELQATRKRRVQEDRPAHARGQARRGRGRQGGRAPGEREDRRAWPSAAAIWRRASTISWRICPTSPMRPRPSARTRPRTPSGAAGVPRATSRPRASSPRRIGTWAPIWASSISSAAPSSPGGASRVLAGAVRLLDRALENFFLNTHIARGFKEFGMPVVVNRNIMFGTGQLPKFEDDAYHVGDDQFLIPTAEVVLTNLHSGEVLDAADLPLRYTAGTPCFREEAGSAGARYARHHPPAPVHQGRDGQVRQAGGVRRRAGEHDGRGRVPPASSWGCPTA